MAWWDSTCDSWSTAECVQGRRTRHGWQGHGRAGFSAVMAYCTCSVQYMVSSRQDSIELPCLSYSSVLSISLRSLYLLVYSYIKSCYRGKRHTSSTQVSTLLNSLLVPECLRITLRRSNIQNVSGGAFPQTPLEGYGHTTLLFIPKALVLITQTPATSW